MPNSHVVVLEKQQGIMDVIRWIEMGRFDMNRFEIVVFLIGRYDIARSRNWFKESVEELIAVVRKISSKALMLWGASLPCLTDSRHMIGEMVARNGWLQQRCKMFRQRKFLEYTRPGKELLAKGGPIQKYYAESGVLNDLGTAKLVVAIMNKFLSASLAQRTLDLKVL